MDFKKPSNLGRIWHTIHIKTAFNIILYHFVIFKFFKKIFGIFIKNSYENLQITLKNQKNSPDTIKYYVMPFWGFFV